MKINKYNIIEYIKLFLNEYKVSSLISIIILLIGASLGIFTILTTSTTIDIESISDTVLLNYIKTEISEIAFSFYYLLDTLITLILISLPICSVFLLPIALIILFQRSYFYFINITILIKCLGVLGLIDAIFIIIPCYLISILLYTFYASIIINTSFNLSKYKSCHMANNCRILVKNTVIFIILTKLILIIYEVFTLSIFCNKFILS